LHVFPSEWIGRPRVSAISVYFSWSLCRGALFFSSILSLFFQAICAPGPIYLRPRSFFLYRISSLFPPFAEFFLDLAPYWFRPPFLPRMRFFPARGVGTHSCPFTSARVERRKFFYITTNLCLSGFFSPPPLFPLALPVPDPERIVVLQILRLRRISSGCAVPLLLKPSILRLSAAFAAVLPLTNWIFM